MCVRYPNVINSRREMSYITHLIQYPPTPPMWHPANHITQTITDQYSMQLYNKVGNAQCGGKWREWIIIHKMRMIDVVKVWRGI